MEDNMRLFNSDHPRGSRYREEAYKKRSKLFRPKTRSGIRKMEASAAAAFFATQDAVSCAPPNPRDPNQRQAADVHGELLNYRLQNDIPWYITCIGALQDAAKQGVVISKQVWNYQEVMDAYEEEQFDTMSGDRVGRRTTYERRVVSDHPDIILRPVENIRFSPAADWRNPIQSSPYLIDLEPFYVADILDKAEVGVQGPYDTKWRKLSMAMIRSALKQSYDPVRQAREGHREDRYEEVESDIQEHDIVWVHHNYMRVDGAEWYYATLGTEIMLSDVVPLEDTTPLKERPYVMGFCTIETHKPYPAGLVELVRPLQEEINDLTNLRMDNIRHIISPRYFIKRGTSVDVRSLLYNIAGGVTAMEDPKNDVNIRQIQDTTSSAFQEHDRLAVEADELIGASSQSSIAANHNINERVGNTQMLGEMANQLTEMTIRTFAETWAEPVLQQVMELERALESDEVVLAIVGQRMGVPPEAVFRMMDMPIKVTVNVGFGATNPQLRLQKVAMAFGTLAQINPQWVMDADKGEVVNEVLGAVGFKSAERFFPALAQAEGEEEDPRVQQLMQDNQMLQQALDSRMQEKQVDVQGRTQVAQMQIESKERLEQLKMEREARKDMGQKELAHAIEQGKWKKIMLDHQIAQEQNQMRKQELVQQRIALNHTITMDERQYEMTRQQMEMETGTEAREPSGGPPKIPDTGVGNSDMSEQDADAPTPTGRRIASQPKLGTEDKAGVIARGDYGAVPFKEG
jgi:hypothetical protein